MYFTKVKHIKHFNSIKYLSFSIIQLQKAYINYLIKKKLQYISLKNNFFLIFGVIIINYKLKEYEDILQIEIYSAVRFEMYYF